MAIPVGHIITTDENHIIKKEDYYNMTHWADDDFYSVEKHAFHWVGKSIKQLNKPHVRVSTKGEEKPRFKSDRPFPYGY